MKYRMMSKGINNEGIKKYFDHEKSEQKNFILREG
jgi:hypothetical protein